MTSASPSQQGASAALSKRPGRGPLLIELTLERSTREERDVNQLVRLDQLLSRFPGRDRVIVRFLLHGKAGPSLALAERVHCDAHLLAELVKEVGERAVRLRRDSTGAEFASRVPKIAAGDFEPWPPAPAPSAAAPVAEPEPVGTD